MRRKIFCALIFLLSGKIAVAQEDQISTGINKPGYLNLSLLMGLSGNISSENLSQTNKLGWNYSIDISLDPNDNHNIGFFINYGSSRLSPEYPYHTTYSTTRNINYSQFAIGPRFYSNSKNSFIDGGVGYFTINNDEVAGITLGLGGKIKISEMYGVAIAGRFNAAGLSEDIRFYYTLSAGLEVNNKDEKTSSQNRSNKFSVSAFAGSYGTGYTSSASSAFNAVLSYDIGRQTTLLLNYTNKNSEKGYYDNFGYYRLYSKNWQNEITGGIRLYTKGSGLRLFAEGMTGLYLISYEYINYPYFISEGPVTTSYYGITFGGGVEFRIIDNLFGSVKTSISNYIREGSYVGVFGGLKYSL